MHRNIHVLPIALNSSKEVQPRFPIVALFGGPVMIYLVCYLGALLGTQSWHTSPTLAPPNNLEQCHLSTLRADRCAGHLY